VVSIGNKGLTEAVQKEISQALISHELIKIRFHSKDRIENKKTAQLICEYHKAMLIYSIGHVIVIYRPQQDWSNFMDIADFLISLFSLTILEIVLGVDNMVFLSIISSRLPVNRLKMARRIGLLFGLLV
jgi:RNA-binding protein YhbY